MILTVSNLSFFLKPFHLEHPSIDVIFFYFIFIITRCRYQPKVIAIMECVFWQFNLFSILNHTHILIQLYKIHIHTRNFEHVGVYNHAQEGIKCSLHEYKCILNFISRRRKLSEYEDVYMYRAGPWVALTIRWLGRPKI